MLLCLTFPPESSVLFPVRGALPAALRDQGQELVGGLPVQVGLSDGTALTQHDVGAGQ